MNELVEQLQLSLSATPPLDLEADRPELRPAGVLVPLVERGGEANLVFTQRTNTVGHHKGQVSFPGGGREEGDPDLCACALREAREEMGIHGVRILGGLDQMATHTGFRIAPFVGIVPKDLSFQPQASEVERIFEVPFAEIVCGFGLRQVDWKGHQVPSYTVDWRGTLIWGVTGWILRSFLRHAAPGKGFE